MLTSRLYPVSTPHWVAPLPGSMGWPWPMPVMVKVSTIGVPAASLYTACGYPPTGVDPVGRLHPVDHLLDGQRLAAAARLVAGEEPVEALVQIVARLLLRQQQGEAVGVRPLGPTCLVVVRGGGLCAPVQRYDER